MTHELDKLLEHSGVKGMHWGVHREQKKSVRKKSERVKKAEKSTVRKAILKSRATRAKWDVDHVDAKTGEYTNQSKTAKTFRTLDKIIGVAAIGIGAATLMMNDTQDNTILHSGVKGMKWGVKRDTRATRKRYNSYNKGMKLLTRSKLKKMSSASDRQKFLDEKDKKWLDKVKDDKKIRKVAQSAAKEMKRVTKDLQKEYGGTGLKGNTKRALNGSMNAAYHKEIKEAYQEVLADRTFATYKLSPSRTREIEIQSLHGGTLKAVIVERDNPKLAKQRAAITKATAKLAKREAAKTIQQSMLLHAEKLDETSDLDGMFFLITLDEDGLPDDVIPPFDDEDDIQQSHPLDDVLLHYGVKGMKWDEAKRQEVVDDTIRGNYGNGEERKAELGERYTEVQDMVNEQIKTGKPAKRPIKKTDVKKLKDKLKKSKKSTTFLERLEKFTSSEMKNLVSKLTK